MWVIVSSIQTNRARCALYKKHLDLLDKESVSGESIVSCAPDSLVVRRESGQILYYVSCLVSQEILGVLIGYLLQVMSCDSLLHIKLAKLKV